MVEIMAGDGIDLKIETPCLGIAPAFITNQMLSFYWKKEKIVLNGNFVRGFVRFASNSEMVYKVSGYYAPARKTRRQPYRRRIASSCASQNSRRRTSSTRINRYAE